MTIFRQNTVAANAVETFPAIKIPLRLDVEDSWLWLSKGFIPQFWMVTHTIPKMEKMVNNKCYDKCTAKAKINVPEIALFWYSVATVKSTHQPAQFFFIL